MTHKDIYTKFMIEYDKANVTSSYPSLTQYEVATLLDKAYLALIARKFTGNNPRQQAFETDIKNMSDLQPLVVHASLELSDANRPAQNVKYFNLPTDSNNKFLYYVQTVLHQTMQGTPLDGITNRSVPAKLIPHELATKFFSTPYNMPWVKNPVCYQEDGKVFVVYDPIKGPDSSTVDFIYIKYPKPFVLGIPDTPTYEDDGDIMDIPEDTNQGGHETPGQSGGNTTPTNPSLGGSQTPENPNQGGSGLLENPSQGDNNEELLQDNNVDTYQIIEEKRSETDNSYTILVYVNDGKCDIGVFEEDFSSSLYNNGVQVYNDITVKEHPQHISISFIIEKPATRFILLYKDKASKEFILSSGSTTNQNPIEQSTDTDPARIIINDNGAYRSATENKITLELNGWLEEKFANKKGAAKFYVTSEVVYDGEGIDISDWTDIYHMWFSWTDGGRTFTIQKEINNSGIPSHGEKYYIKAEVYENEEFRTWLYTTKPEEVYNTTTSKYEEKDFDGIQILHQLLKENGNWVYKFTVSVTDEDLRNNISRYYVEIQKGYNYQNIWSANPIELTTMSSENNYSITKTIDYEGAWYYIYARAKLWSYNPPEGLAFNYYSKPITLDHDVR